LPQHIRVFYALKEVYTSATSDPTNKGLLVGHPKSAASRRRLSIPADLIPLVEQHLATASSSTAYGYAVLREVDNAHGILALDGQPTDPERLLFTTPDGYAVLHNSFAKRVLPPPSPAAPPSERAAVASR
jgi:hypothetical protein